MGDGIANRRRNHNDYTVGWICALRCEFEAARLMLDAKHDQLEILGKDENTYEYGEIGGHNIVIACLPFGVYGTTAAAAVGQQMMSTFPSIDVGLMVGIGAGVPSAANDIRLGDVVVSKPTPKGGGVVQYDYGKALHTEQFEETGHLNKPSKKLLTAIPKLGSDEESRDRVRQIVEEVVQRTPSLAGPSRARDRLFQPSYTHPNTDQTCETCDTAHLIHRETRISNYPYIHYGLIASGNQVIKDAVKRDKLAGPRQILCFEMEAAGLMDDFSCLVVRGICDYADSHKNKEWQEYAALVAAAYAKSLLLVVPQRRSPSKDTQQGSNEEAEGYLKELFITDSQENRRRLMATKGGPSPNTCHWIVETPQLRRWFENTQQDKAPIDSVFWLHGLPGSGKSTLSMFLTEELEARFCGKSSANLAYFFCEASYTGQNSATAILRGLLHQIISKHTHLQAYLESWRKVRKPEAFQTFDALWTLFLDIILDQESGRKYCIIDALDECDIESQKCLLKHFKLSFIDRPSQRLAENIRILITSRPYPEIQRYLLSFPNHDLGSFPHAREDVETFIELKVNEMAVEKKYPQKMKERVKEILAAKTDGTFLWVGVTCNEMSDIYVSETIIFLESLPQGLNALYLQLMKKAFSNVAKRTVVRQILAFVAVARQPLSPLQLCIACNLYPEEEDDIRVSFLQHDIQLCRLMVIERENIVTLLHKSVQDFLFRSDYQDFPTAQEVNAQFAYSCIDHLQNICHSHLGSLETLLAEYVHLHGFIGNAQCSVKADYDAQRKVKVMEPRVREGVLKLGDFVSYCVRYWMEHAHCAFSEFHIQPSRHGAFFLHESSCRERWVLLYRSIVRYSLYDDFSLLRIASRWSIPQLVGHAFDGIGGHNSCVGENFYHQYHNTPLEQAIQAGDMTMVTKLLATLKMKIGITPKTIKLAASNSQHGEALTQMIIQHNENRALITEELEVTAAENEGCGPEVLAILLSYRKGRYPISQPVFLAACKNKKKGSQVFKLLKSYICHQNTSTTEEMLKAAAGNPNSGVELVDILLPHWEPIQIPETVFTAAAGNAECGGVILERLLPLRKNAPITEPTLAAAAGNTGCGRTLMEKMLSYWKDPGIPNSVVAAAAGNLGQGECFMELIIQRYLTELQITDLVLSRALWNPEKGIQVLELLSSNVRGSIALNEKSLQNENGHGAGGPHMKWILDQPTQDFEFTDDAIFAIFAMQSCDVVAKLMKRQNGKLNITEKVMKRIFSNRQHGLLITELLCDNYATEIPLSPSLMEQAAETNPKIFALLLKHGSGRRNLITQKVIGRACWHFPTHPQLLDMVFDAYGQHMHIDETIILGFRRDSARNALERLLRQHNVTAEITGRMLDSGNSKLLTTICLHQLLSLPEDKVKINVQAVKTIVEYRKPDTARLLIDRWRLALSNSVIRSIVANFDGNMVSLLLERHGQCVHVTGDIVSAALESSDASNIVGQLIKHAEGEVMLDGKAFTFLIENCERNVIQLFLQKQPLEILNPVMIEAMAKRAQKDIGGFSIVQNLLESRSDLSGLREETMVEIIRCCEASAIKLLLSQTTISKLKVLRESLKNRSYGLEIVALLKEDWLGKLQITDDVGYDIACTGDLDVMEYVLNSLSPANPAKITRLLESAAHNKENGMQLVVRILRLWEGEAKDIEVTERIIDATSMNAQSRIAIIDLLVGYRPIKVKFTAGALRAIIRGFNCGVLQQLVAEGICLPLDDDAIEAAASNASDGRNILEFLISLSPTRIRVTGRAVYNAARNASLGQEIIKLFILEKQVILSKSAVQQVMEIFDISILQALFQHRQGLVTASSNFTLSTCDQTPNGMEILDYVLDQTEDIVTFGVSFFLRQKQHDNICKVLRRALDKGNKIRITALALVELVQHITRPRPIRSHLRTDSKKEDLDLLRSLLRLPNVQVELDDRVIKAFLSASYDLSVADILLKCRRKEIIITSAIETSSSDVVCSLLDPSPTPLPVTASGAVKLIRKRDHYNHYINIRLLEPIIPRVEISHDFTMEIAAGSHATVMALLLDRFEKYVSVNEDVLCAATTNHGKNMINLLLNRMNVTITARVVAAAATNPSCGCEILDLISRYQGNKSIPLSEEVLQAVAANEKQGSDILRFLLTKEGSKRVGKCITESVLLTTAQNTPQRQGIMNQLIENYGLLLPLTEDVLAANAIFKLSHMNIRRLLMTISPGYPSSYLLMAVVTFCDLETVQFVFTSWKEHIFIDEDLMIAAAARHDELKLLKLLLAQNGVHALQDNATIEDGKGGEISLMQHLPNAIEPAFITGRIIKTILDYGHSDFVVFRLLVNCCDRRVQISSDAVKHLIKTGSKEILFLILLDWHCKIAITPSILKWIVRRHSGEAMQRLLRERGTEITITEDVLTAVVGNYQYGMGLLPSIFEHFLEDAVITEEVFLEIVPNWENGDRILNMFLARHRGEIVLTSRMVAAASLAEMCLETDYVWNRKTRYQAIYNLRDVKSHLKDRRDLIDQLLSQRDKPVSVTSDAFALLIKLFGWDFLKPSMKCEETGFRIVRDATTIHPALDIMLYPTNIHDENDTSIRIGEKQLIAAMSYDNPKNEEILSFFLDYCGYPLLLTESLMLAAVRTRHNSVKILNLLLSFHSGDVPLTQSITVEAAKNVPQGKGILRLLLDRFGERVPINEEVLIAATEPVDYAEFPSSFETFEDRLLLLVQQNRCKVTSRVLASAIRDAKNGVKMLHMLQEYDQNIPVTEEVLIEAALNGDLREHLFPILLSFPRRESLITEKVIQASITPKTYLIPVKKLEIPDCLFNPSNYQEPMSIGTLVQFMKPFGQLQFQRYVSQLTTTQPDELAVGLAEHCEERLMEWLFADYGEKVTFSESLMHAAARNSSVDITKFLLHKAQRLKKCVAITESVIITAVGNISHDTSSIKLLLDRAEGFDPVSTEALVNAARYRTTDLLRLLFDYSKWPPVIGSSLLAAAAANISCSADMLRFIFNEAECRGEHIAIAEEIVIAAAANQGIEYDSFTWNSSVGLLVRRHKDKITVAENILSAATRNQRNGANAIKLLLDCDEAKSNITEAVIVAAAQNELQGYHILSLLLNNTITKQDVSSRILEAAVGNLRFGNKMVKLLRKYHQKPLKLTERIVVAATQNRLRGKKIIEFLLKENEEPIRISEDVLERTSQTLGFAIAEKIRERKARPQQRGMVPILFYLVSLALILFLVFASREVDSMVHFHILRKLVD